MDKTIYVVYPRLGMANYDYDKAEMFTTLQRAEEFGLIEYGTGRFVISPELADEDLFEDIQENEPK